MAVRKAEGWHDLRGSRHDEVRRSVRGPVFVFPALRGGRRHEPGGADRRAHAGCFDGFANELAKPAFDHVQTVANVYLGRTDAGFRITRIHLEARPSAGHRRRAVPADRWSAKKAAWSHRHWRSDYAGCQAGSGLNVTTHIESAFSDGRVGLAQAPYQI